MNMLTPEDLKAIGKVIQEVVPPMLKSEIDGLEERMNVKFDAVHEQIAGLEQRIDRIEEKVVTKDYLDGKLSMYVLKPA